MSSACFDSPRSRCVERAAAEGKGGLSVARIAHATPTTHSQQTNHADTSGATLRLSEDDNPLIV